MTSMECANCVGTGWDPDEVPAEGEAPENCCPMCMGSGSLPAPLPVPHSWVVLTASAMAVLGLIMSSPGMLIVGGAVCAYSLIARWLAEPVRAKQ